MNVWLKLMFKSRSTFSFVNVLMRKSDNYPSEVKSRAFYVRADMCILKLFLTYITTFLANIR